MEWRSVCPCVAKRIRLGPWRHHPTALTFNGGGQFHTKVGEQYRRVCDNRDVRTSPAGCQVAPARPQVIPAAALTCSANVPLRSQRTNRDEREATNESLSAG